MVARNGDHTYAKTDKVRYTRPHALTFHIHNPITLIVPYTSRVPWRPRSRLVQMVTWQTLCAKPPPETASMKQVVPDPKPGPINLDLSLTRNRTLNYNPINPNQARGAGGHALRA